MIYICGRRMDGTHMRAGGPVNRIIGHTELTESKLVFKAFSRIKGNLSNIHIFHTDRGNELKTESLRESFKLSG